MYATTYMALSKMDCPNDTISTGHLAAVEGDHIHTEVAEAFNIRVQSRMTSTAFALLPDLQPKND